MSEQYRKEVEQSDGANHRGNGSAVAGANGNGDLRAVTNKMEHAVKLLAELSEHVAKIAPEHKHVFDDARAAITDFGSLLTHAPDSFSGNVTRIVAPMPGVIIRCEKQPGEQVKKGEVVVVLDAMKVENPIMVPVSGKIISIRHREGERVAKGSVLAILNH